MSFNRPTYYHRMSIITKQHQQIDRLLHEIGKVKVADKKEMESLGILLRHELSLLFKIEENIMQSVNSPTLGVHRQMHHKIEDSLTKALVYVQATDDPLVCDRLLEAFVKVFHDHIEQHDHWYIVARLQKKEK